MRCRADRLRAQSVTGIGKEVGSIPLSKVQLYDTTLHAVAQSRVVNLNLAQGDRTYFLTDDRLRVGPGVARYDAAPMLSCSPAGAQASAGR